MPPQIFCVIECYITLINLTERSFEVIIKYLILCILYNFTFELPLQYRNQTKYFFVVDVY